MNTNLSKTECNMEIRGGFSTNLLPKSLFLIHFTCFRMRALSHLNQKAYNFSLTLKTQSFAFLIHLTGMMHLA